MSQKDSSSKIKAQPGGGSGRKSGNTRYRMQAAMAQEEAARAAAEQQAKLQAQRGKDQPQTESARSQSGQHVQPSNLQPGHPAQPAGESDDPVSEDNVRGLWKARVLASYKGKSPKDSHTLLAKIPDGKAVVQVSDHFKTTNVQEAMITTVDKMFDVLQNCAYEFNKVAQGSELELNWIRPFLSKESTSAWHQDQGFVLVFSGRMSTRRWTLVVKGTQEEVVIYILPTDKLIGFALSHKNFKPYVTFVPFADELDVRWKIYNQVIEPEYLLLVYKELFDALIRFAREEANLDEKFDLRSVGIEPTAEGKDEEAERQRFYQEQFFQDMRSRQEDFAPAPHAPAPSYSGSFTGSTGEDGLNRPAQDTPSHGDPFQTQAPPPQIQPPNQSRANQAHLNMPAMQPSGQVMPQALQAEQYGQSQGQAQGQTQAYGQAQGYGQGHATPTGTGTGQSPVPGPGQGHSFGTGQMAGAGQVPDPSPFQGTFQGQTPGHMPPQASGANLDPFAVPYGHEQGHYGNQQPGSGAPPQAGYMSGPAGPSPSQPQQAMPQQAMPQPGAHYGQAAHSASQQMTSQQHLHQIQSHQQALPAEHQPVMPQPAAPPQQAQYGQNQNQGQIQAAAAQEPDAIFDDENLGDVLQALVTCLDRELEVVAKAGADAFAQRDLNRADAALKFSERLTDFRSVAHELLSYYKDR